MSYSISTLLTTSSVKTTLRVGARQSTRSSPKIACSMSPRASTEAATRSIASRARSRLLTLTFDISQLLVPRNWAMAGGSNGYRAALVRRFHHCPGRPDCRRLSLFRQATLSWTLPCDVLCTGAGKLVRKATGYEQQKVEAALSHIGFAGCESSFRPPLERIGDPQISPTRQKYFVPILYRDPAFEAFGDFSDFLESISCEA